MFIRRFITPALILITSLTGAVAAPQNSTTQNSVPFSFTVPKGFQLQPNQSPGVSVWISPKACAITLISGKTKIETYLWEQIYKNQDNLNAYYQKFAQQDGTQPQKIINTKTVKTRDGITIPVYYSTQTNGQKTAVFWDSLYTSGDNYTTVSLQCAQQSFSEKQALMIFSSLKKETVSNMADDLKALPFQLSPVQPYYISSTSATLPLFAGMTLKQATDQIHNWPETEAFINYDKGPYASISDFIEKSPIAEKMQLKSRPFSHEENKALKDKEMQIYTFQKKGQKNTSILYLTRSTSGEMLALLAVMNSDKLPTYRPLVDRMAENIKFLSDENAAFNWKHGQ